MHKKLGDKYYKKKGVVEEVKDNYTGVVSVTETGDLLKIDQSHLETVIPAIGEWVKAAVSGCVSSCDLQVSLFWW